MSHWKNFPLVSILYIYRILCKQWDLNPHSFTLLFPKNSLSTNFNMLTHLEKFLFILKSFLLLKLTIKRGIKFIIPFYSLIYSDL